MNLRTRSSPWSFLEHSVFQLEFGAFCLPGDEGVRFRVWAPRPERVHLRRVSRGGPDLPMGRLDGDVHEVVDPEARPGDDYAYVLDGGPPRPDPVSRWQPHGVHGPSRVLDPRSHSWMDLDWKGRPLREYVFYELHVGTFSPPGTFEGVLPQLDRLAELGITAIELMPVAEFPGHRNWGYDGVHLYAPQSSYGGPEGLRRLVEACHLRDMAVVLDVVYNHLGPEGNYLGEYAPCFTSTYRSAWGDAMNFDGPGSDGVRRHIIENALYWQTEYHIDALRLDAVHGIFDFSALHILDEMAQAFHKNARRLGRPGYLIAESDLNDSRLIRPREEGGHALDAQWSDDFHHSLHTVLTGDRCGYFSDFGRVAHLAKSYTNGYVYDGVPSEHRGRRHGNSSGSCPGECFVVYTQNHDQVANGSMGRRHPRLLSPGALRLSTLLLLCAPNLPMLFMGQEYGETAPFLFFTDFGDEKLARAVKRGRKREVAALGGARSFADPQDIETFRRCVLDHSRAAEGSGAALVRFHRDLLELRRTHPALRELRRDETRTRHSETERWLVLTRGHEGGVPVMAAANLSDEEKRVPLVVGEATWRRLLWTEESRYGGSGGDGPPAELRSPSPAAPEGLVLGPWEGVLYGSGTWDVRRET